MQKTLRPYQREQLIDLSQALQKQDSALLQGVTGSGKGVQMSYIFNQVIKTHGQIMFCVYGRAVVDAFCDELAENGIDHTVMMAGEDYSNTHDAVVASISSLQSWYFSPNARYSTDELMVPRLLVVDEARKLVTPANQKIFAWFRERGTKIIGFDATPKAKGLGLIYEDIIHGKSTPWHIEQGNLAPVVHYAPAMNDQQFMEDLKELRKRSHGDYSDKDMEKLCQSNVLIGDLVTNYERISLLEYGSYRPFVVACMNKRHAKSVLTAFLEAGHEVEYIDGDTPRDERRQMFERVRSGETLGIISVLVMIYGVNVKPLEIAILARPTADIRLLLQYGGRVLRLSPETGKGHATFIDHTKSLQDLGFIDDEYSWSLDESQPVVNETRKKREEETTVEHVDITCRSCGYVYQNSAVCPKCGEKNLVSYEEPNVLYYNKELEQQQRDAKARHKIAIEHDNFLKELKKYVDSKSKNVYDALNQFNAVTSLKFQKNFTPQMYDNLEMADDYSASVASYVKYVKIRRSKRRT